MNRNKTKPECVFLMKKDGKPYRYMVRTYINKERRYIGCFKTQDEAVKAYNAFMQREHNKQLQLQRL